MKSATLMGYIIIQSSIEAQMDMDSPKTPSLFFTWRRAEFYFEKLILYLEEQIIAH